MMTLEATELFYKVPVETPEPAAGQAQADLEKQLMQKKRESLCVLWPFPFLATKMG